MMNLELNKTYHGFILQEEREIKELKSTARLFVHTKSGARLLNVQNDDDNKVFSISFRTPPENSTGLPHILEHCVLAGSRKFTTKEPFVDLIKGSLNTFLNAMTFSDKTMYPVASRNEKDFFNLMDVYMDAVFYPSIYKYPETLMQEGWHYELENKEDQLTYKGVVYNEMKGAFSAPESILMRKIQESLFPDTPYKHESGGDPEVIPELTQEEFLAFHEKYYHPANSYIYLYGDGDIVEQLKFIDQNYLKDFDAIEINSAIPLQNAFDSTREMMLEYPISQDEEEKDKSFLALNFAVGTSIDAELYSAIEILEHLLLGTPASPLKKALIDAQIGKDVFGKLDNGILQPTFSIVVKNTNLEQKEKFQEVVYSTLRKLVEEGIDKKLIEASINIKEFILREANFQGYPKGLLYNIKSMESWLYDAHPTLHLEYEQPLQAIKAALTTDYFEKMIEKYFLNNTHSSLIVLQPQKGLAEAKAKELKEQLAQYKATLSDEELENIINQSKNLKKRQTEPDTAEDLATVPKLALEDVEPKVENLPLVEKSEEGIKLLAHPIFTNGIAYVNLLFDIRNVEQQNLHYAALLSDILGKVSTEKYGYEDLSNETNIHTGGISFAVDIYSDKDDDSKYYPMLGVKSKSLVTKLDRLMEMIGEILGTSKFQDTKRLKEIIQQTKSQMEMKIFNQGHMVAGKRLLSYFSPVGKAIEYLTGIEYYRFVADLEKNFDQRAEAIVSSLDQVAKDIFNKENLTISLTCDEKDYNSFVANFGILTNRLGNRAFDKKQYSFEFKAENEGLLTQGKVQYVAKGYNFAKLGYSYSGKMNVLRSIVGFDYLWNLIRVQGGAYGSFANFDRQGNMFFASYRDPNLVETLRVYDQSAQYLKDFKADEEAMTKYIIGTISRMDSPLTPSMKGERAAINYIRGISQEDIQRERDEVLNTSQEDIQQFAELIEKAMEQNYLCVLGNEDKIKENKDIFNKLVKIFD